MPAAVPASSSPSSSPAGHDRTVVVVCLLAMAAGGLLIAAPDRGDAVFRFSGAHGPAPLDLAGAVAVVAAWLVLVRTIRRSARPSSGPVLPFGLGLGAGLVLASVVGDWPHWWVVGVAALALAQTAWAVRIWRHPAAGDTDADRTF